MPRGTPKAGKADYNNRVDVQDSIAAARKAIRLLSMVDGLDAWTARFIRLLDERMTHAGDVPTKRQLALLLLRVIEFGGPRYRPAGAAHSRKDLH